MNIHIFIYGVVIYSLVIFALYTLARKGILWVYERPKNIERERQSEISLSWPMAKEMRQTPSRERKETLSYMRSMRQTNVMPTPLLSQVSVLPSEIRLGQFNPDMQRLSYETPPSKRPKHTRSSHPKTGHRVARDAVTEEIRGNKSERGIL